MRSEILYLTDVVEAADAIGRFLEGAQRDDFPNDEMRQRAVVQKLAVIGEAASHVSKELRGRHPEVQWSKAISLRNVAVHEYFNVDWLIVWDTATLDVPALREQIAAILEEVTKEQDQSGADEPD